ncbi:MAG TPA: YdeI/OmpD-associated family protein [Lacunisphaera sp.]|nr:YdeI/OmpD-associated family protein [Lacunisphaera sp.]
MSRARYFTSAAEFRHWLEANHATARELLVGFHKVGSGRGGLTYSEAVDELLCFGWIDGLKQRVDDERYTHRITPRRPGSKWSQVNVGHARRLIAAGRMSPAGLAAFQAHLRSKVPAYSFADRAQEFPPELTARFRRHAAAWRAWRQLPPGYQRTAIHWVTDARQDETKLRRLARLMDSCVAGRRLF